MHKLRDGCLLAIAATAAALLWPIAVVTWYHALGPWPAAALIALGLGATLVFHCRSRARRSWIRTLTFVSVTAIAGFVLGVGYVLTLSPRHDRNWPAYTSVLPTLTFDDDRVTIDNVRKFRWDGTGGFDEHWERREVSLADLRGLELIVEPLRDSTRFAHTMLNFDFGPGGHVCLSIEARSEVGERYGTIPGALRQFELVYLFLDERDALTLRAVQRGARLDMYPIRAEPAELRALFRKVADVANDLHGRPRFYRSVFDNCTSAWLGHIDQLNGHGPRWRTELMFTARTADLAHRLGRIDTNLPFAQAREHFRIDEYVRRHADDPDFGRLIRVRSGEGSDRGEESIAKEEDGGG